MGIWEEVEELSVSSKDLDDKNSISQGPVVSGWTTYEVC